MESPSTPEHFGLDDPDAGSNVLRKEIERQEKVIRELRDRLGDAHEKIREAEREREGKYNKMRAEVYEGSLSLIKELQQGQTSALEVAFAFLSVCLRACAFMRA